MALKLNQQDTRNSKRLPEVLHLPLAEIVAEIGEYQDKIKRLDQSLARIANDSIAAQRMLRLQGIGPVIVTAMLGRVPNPRFSAWPCLRFLAW